MKLSPALESTFRAMTPLVLLGALLAVVFEPWLPGAAWLKAQFGEQVIVRGAIVVLVFYVLLLWGEAIRLHSILTGVLSAFRQYERGDGGKGSAAKNPKTRLEAARLLVAAMASGDEAIRTTCRHNLTKLAGEDHGDDPAAWQAWLRQQEQSH